MNNQIITQTENNLLDGERALLASGVSERLVRADVALRPRRYELEPVLDVARVQVAKLARKFIERLHIVEMFGQVATVEFVLLQQSDPRIVLPLFAVADKTARAYGRMLRNLGEFDPHRPSDYLFAELDRDLGIVSEEMSFRLRRPQFDYFVRTMSLIVYDPLSWYGKTAVASQRERAIASEFAIRRGATSSPAVAKIANSRRESPALRQLRQDADKIRAGVESGFVHYTALIDAENEIRDFRS